MELGELVSWMNEFLDIASFPDDQSVNGLQVEAGQKIEKIVTSVDVGLEVFKLAKKSGADLLITHHGLYWKGAEFLMTGINADRIKSLLDNKLSLYSCHLPLDVHPKIGNNVLIMQALGITEYERFGKIGYSAKLKLELSELVSLVSDKIGKTNLLKFGSDKVNNLIVSSGGSTDTVFSAPTGSTFLLGEFQHYGYHFAKEKQLNIISAGHYATETFGVRALGNTIQKKFGLECKFIDIPTHL
ncbi:MAG: Nif3-like dinuclear metal center hexameric protein [Candidatus Altiarchaeota archaeon]|nr:Nif3-like dinuclear metal center hexameric protein [Candidatus Altiarchaeota archaeon]